MCRVSIFVIMSFLIFAGFVSMGASPAQARCSTFQESHNGTDLFNPQGGAKTAATRKLMYSIEGWKQQRGIKRVRIGKVSTRCDKWTAKYLLPHHRCYARARLLLKTREMSDDAT